jgi:hypothetical protein
MQEAIVGLIVLAAAAYAAWSLMPRAWREALRRRWAPDSVPSEGRPCSSCSDCGACGPASPSARRDAVQKVHIVRTGRDTP